MATVTIRNLPVDLVERIKAAAARNGRSMEQEIRRLLQRRYRPREDVLRKVRERWESTPAPRPDDVEAWIESGRQ